MSLGMMMRLVHRLSKGKDSVEFFPAKPPFGVGEGSEGRGELFPLSPCFKYDECNNDMVHRSDSITDVGETKGQAFDVEQKYKKQKVDPAKHSEPNYLLEEK